MEIKEIMARLENRIKDLSNEHSRCLTVIDDYDEINSDEDVTKGISDVYKRADKAAHTLSHMLGFRKELLIRIAASNPSILTIK